MIHAASLRSVPLTLFFILFSNALFAERGGVTPPPKYEKALKELRALGLPSLKGAQWGKCQSPVITFLSHFNQHSGLQLILKNAELGCWKLEDEANYLILQPNSPSLFTLGKEDTTWVAEDITEFSKRLIKTIQSTSDISGTESLKKGTENIDITELLYYNESALGEILLFSAQLADAGHSFSANQLADALFNSLPEEQRPSIINQAIQILVEDALSSANHSFRKHHDWTQYRTSLSKICKQFPRGWSALESVQDLVTKIQSQENTSPPKVTIPERYNISEETLSHISLLSTPIDFTHQKQVLEKQIDILLTTNGKNIFPDSHMELMLAYLSNVPANWLITLPEDNKSSFHSLLEKRWEAILVLAHLLDDDTLTPHFKEKSDSLDSNNSPESTLPLHTRGSLAQKLILATIPLDNHFDSLEDLKTKTIKLWQDHHNAAPAQFVKALLKDYSLDINQQQHLITTLISSESPESHQVIQEYILNAEYPASMIYIVHNYISHTEDTNFLDKFCVLLEKKLEGVTAENAQDYQARHIFQQSSSVEDYIKTLKQKLSGNGIKTFISKVKQGEILAINAIRQLNAYTDLSSAEKIADTFFLLFEESYQSSGTERESLLSICYYLSYYLIPSGSEDVSPYLKKHSKLFSEYLTINDAITIPKSPLYTIDSAVAAIINGLHERSFSQNSYYYLLSHPEEGPDLIVERAKAILKNSSIPEIPTTKDYPLDTLNERLAPILELKGSELLDGINHLTNMEKFVIYEKLYTDPAFSMLREKVYLIYNTASYTQNTILLPHLPLQKGDYINKETIQKVIDKFVTLDLQKHSTISFSAGLGIGNYANEHEQTIRQLLKQESPKDALEFLKEQSASAIIIAELYHNYDTVRASFPGDLEAQDLFYEALEEVTQMSDKNLYLTISYLPSSSLESLINPK